MGWKTGYLSLSMSVGLALATTPAARAAGFEPLPAVGNRVLIACNPGNSLANTHCKVTSLPGEAGFTLVAARTAPLIYNDITIGSVYQKVWRNSAHRDEYIFGTRIVLNADQWDASGLAFNANDLFQQTLPDQPVAVGYFLNGATQALFNSGRTIQGLNEFDTEQPDRDNTWVDFRTHVDALNPDGSSDPSSAWLLTKTRAPCGFAINTLGLRILNSDVADAFDAVDFFTASYQPNGVPPPGDSD